MYIQVVPTYLEMFSRFISTYLLSPYGHNMDNYGEREGGTHHTPPFVLLYTPPFVS
jgi:hypothetical protein